MIRQTSVTVLTISSVANQLMVKFVHCPARISKLIILVSHCAGTHQAVVGHCLWVSGTGSGWPLPDRSASRYFISYGVMFKQY